ncbi:hypothetical protein MC885_019303 [Smutsia gigantea]|nr:hypothetical protein MC885_019303 [Smutsia gigantea]
MLAVQVLRLLGSRVERPRWVSLLLQTGLRRGGGAQRDRCGDTTVSFSLETLPSNSILVVPVRSQKDGGGDRAEVGRKKRSGRPTPALEEPYLAKLI